MTIQTDTLSKMGIEDITTKEEGLPTFIDKAYEVNIEQTIHYFIENGQESLAELVEKYRHFTDVESEWQQSVNNGYVLYKDCDERKITLHNRIRYVQEEPKTKEWKVKMLAKFESLGFKEKVDEIKVLGVFFEGQSDQLMIDLYLEIKEKQYFYKKEMEMAFLTFLYSEVV